MGLHLSRLLDGDSLGCVRPGAGQSRRLLCRSYGPESRGGTSYADVHVAREEVLSPAAPNPDILIAFNSPSLHKFGPAVRSGGTIIYDASVITTLPQLPDTVRVYGYPMTEIALDLELQIAKNIVALGVLQATTNIFPAETFLHALRDSLKHKPESIEVNLAAFENGQAVCMAE